MQFVIAALIYGTLLNLHAVMILADLIQVFDCSADPGSQQLRLPRHFGPRE